MLISIGDELLHGRVVDTNAAWLSGRLEALGFRVHEIRGISDVEEQLVELLAEVTPKADLCVATGGLGPTADDRTRAAVARAAGVEHEFDERSWTEIQRWFEKRERPLDPSNKTQAFLPAGARSLPNHLGTAPGFLATIGSCRFAALPGVPSEMRGMTAEALEPVLGEVFGDRLRPLAHRTLWVLGPSEAELGSILEDRMVPGGPVEVGVTAKEGLLVVRVAAQSQAEVVQPIDASREEAERLALEVADDIVGRLGPMLLYRGEDSPSTALVHRLLRSKQTLASAESCTGGMLAAAWTDVPGSSAVFPGGFVVYSNEQKTVSLGVPRELLDAHGAVSELVAQSMAEGARRETGADFALATSGIAGPRGGSDEKPVGTVCFGLATPFGSRAWTRHFPNLGRDFVRQRSVWEATATMLRELGPG
ncbi:MAG: CinA family nicotinamide mononucleotide deamidase-related protein [Planctomycetota bacterium]